MIFHFFFSKYGSEHNTGVCACVCVSVWAKPGSVLKHISEPQCFSCGGRRERRLKCKELPPWLHSDLRGAMETSVMGRRGSLDVDVSLLAKADNLLKSNSSDECSVCA